MAKFIKYSLFWVGSLILFNLICFLAPIRKNGFDDGSKSFWVVYGFIMVAFILHFLFSYIALDEKKKEKRILNTPLLYISTTELFILATAGLVCMAIPGIPNWLKIIIVYALLLIFILFLLTAKTVGETTQAANIELNQKTFNFRMLTDRAQELTAIADTPEKKQIAQSVYDKIRYSDMVSDPRLSDIEGAIFAKMNELTDVYQKGNDIRSAKGISDELIQLIDRRNNECKNLKRMV